MRAEQGAISQAIERLQGVTILEIK